MQRRSKAQLNQAITAASQHFVSGNTIQASLIEEIFAIAPLRVTRLATAKAEVTRHQLQMLTAYTRLNRLLRNRGLVLKQSHGNYEVLGLQRAQHKVEKYYAVADRNNYQAAQLRRGLVTHRSQWSSLTDEELQRGAPL